MANLSEDIQCAGSDTQPPMLDRNDFSSWQQRIRLYCLGKENRVNILESIDEGPFQIGTFRETLAEGNEGALHLGLERPRVYSDLSPKDKERYNADIRATNILLQGLPKDIYSLINHYTDAKDIWDNVKMLLEGSELTKDDRESQLYDDFENFHQHKGETIHDHYVWFAKLINDMCNIKMTMSRMQLNSKFVNNMLPEWGRFVTAVKLNRGLRDSNYDQQVDIIEDRVTMHGVHVQLVIGELRTELGMLIQVKQGRLSATTMENRVAFDEEHLLFIGGGQDNADVYVLVVSANDKKTKRTIDAVCEHLEIHEMHDDVQPNYVVDSHADYTSDSNMILYDQYIKDNTNNVVAKSLTAELATYKEQVELYERRDRFELMEREQKIDEQLRIVITDCNIKEENLQKELHSVKLQLSSSINHNKSMVEEVMSLKKDFKQKENKLYKQDQSLQIVHMLHKPKLYYDEKNKVDIGYKNPLCLTRTKQVQSALYNGHEIIKTNHVPAIVHNSEDTLEIAEITRKKMNDKMKDPECLKKRVKIAPPDYSRENCLATFTPHKQLTPEQIFWFNDLIGIKAEALKEQTKVSRPIKALTMYPPNTPAMLIPRVLPTKSQVKINIFTLIQLFSEFEKICKKRITPTGLTEGERGFEQTKKCYLTEVIPFFKTLKEHFEGIQKALTKEIKEMKDIFEELEAEVDQNVVHRKHAEIERKNLLIANDNLIADCLSKDVFYITTNSELTVSRFTKMHDAHTVVQARCLELEAELSKLRDKIQTDDHNELVNRFSNLEVNHLNLQLKYQNLKESFGNNPPPPARETPDFDSVFVIGKMKASLQGKDNVIKKLKMQISQLKETRSEADVHLILGP
ncbi:hypothetical protein Tco_1328633 [Tanacetum coccineum]